jgi:hypothetical protein
MMGIITKYDLDHILLRYLEKGNFAVFSPIYRKNQPLEPDLSD